MSTKPIQETLTHYVSGFNNGTWYYWTGKFWVDNQDSKLPMTEREAHLFVSRRKMFERDKPEEERMNPLVEPLEESE